jgi:hypothetical protein
MRDFHVIITICHAASNEGLTLENGMREGAVLVVSTCVEKVRRSRPQRHGMLEATAENVLDLGEGYHIDFARTGMVYIALP